MRKVSGVRGEMHPNSRLSQSQVREIFHRANSGENQMRLAKKFKVNQRTISAIKLGKRWKSLNLLKEKADD